MLLLLAVLLGHLVCCHWRSCAAIFSSNLLARSRTKPEATTVAGAPIGFGFGTGARATVGRFDGIAEDEGVTGLSRDLLHRA
jgi:hypothetical protein